MFIKKNSDPTPLQIAIDKLFVELSDLKGDSEEYSKVAAQLSALYKLKEVDSKSHVSVDTMAGIAGSLAGILLIIGHERANVIGSKALGFVMKLR